MHYYNNLSGSLFSTFSILSPQLPYVTWLLKDGALNCSWFAVVISCEDGSFGVCFFSSIILWLFISNSAFYIGLWLIYLLTLHFHVSIVVLSCEGNLNVSVMWEWIHLKLIFNQMYHFILILWKKNRYIYIYCNSVN